jgi:hypothetical protein
MRKCAIRAVIGPVKPLQTIAESLANDGGGAGSTQPRQVLHSPCGYAVGTRCYEVHSKLKKHAEADARAHVGGCQTGLLLTS